MVTPEKRQEKGEVEVTVMVDEGRPGSAQPLHYLLEPLTRLPRPGLHLLFLPLHPQVSGIHKCALD